MHGNKIHETLHQSKIETGVLFSGNFPGGRESC